MKRQMAQMCLITVIFLSLVSCGEIVREPETMLSGNIDLEKCEAIRGMVLDASGENLFLRADDGSEYVFSLSEATIRVEDHLQAQQYVEVFYTMPKSQMDLTESNSKRAQVEYICQPQQ